MALKYISGPATEAVTLAEAKAHARVTISDDDNLITSYVKMGRQYIESWLGRMFVEQTWELTLDAFPDDAVQLPLAPLISVTSVKYLDADAVEQTLDPLEYQVDADSEPGWIIPVTAWPETGDYVNAVRVRFKCGYLNAASVPEPLKLANLMCAAHMYDQRHPVIVGTIASNLPGLNLDQLLWPWRVYQ
jgi:uncharacterized phiE125 gp8 family phage protein